MPPPTSSRSIDPGLASASGVMRDTVGAIHNLLHLLGSMRVGPKALAQVIPDVRASCAPMIAAASTLRGSVEGTRLDTPSVAALERLVTSRMTELDKALRVTRSATLRAGERLALEATIGRLIPDLDGALDLVDLLAEASTTGSVPVDVTDVIRESAARPDTSSGRAARAFVAFEPPAEPIFVNANPRLAMRLFAFAVALAARPHTVVTVAVGGDAERCTLSLSPTRSGAKGNPILTPTLVALSLPFAVEVATGAGASLAVEEGERRATLILPVALPE